ncbi:metallothionein-3 [Ctenocephalides felis]|uniref:metallothionein-3 n=1 Tax=Ctenocephalides felis TaxID=7515 RepID=UPI000E6E56B6|nr:metallothionein-3 [Ctenocephalides felis]
MPCGGCDSNCQCQSGCFCDGCKCGPGCKCMTKGQQGKSQAGKPVSTESNKANNE